MVPASATRGENKEKRTQDQDKENRADAHPSPIAQTSRSCVRHKSHDHELVCSMFSPVIRLSRMRSLHTIDRPRITESLAHDFQQRVGLMTGNDVVGPLAGSSGR